MAVLTLTLLCVGRLKAGAGHDLAARYLDRAALAGRALGLAVELRELTESKARRAADRKAEEAVAILASTTHGTLVAFDEIGTAIDSPAFAAILRRTLDAGAGPLTLAIGGADGLDGSVRAAATHVVALGAMTWPHQLARIMVAEQVYRAMTILGGHPYHRA